MYTNIYRFARRTTLNLTRSLQLGSDSPRASRYKRLSSKLLTACGRQLGLLCATLKKPLQQGTLDELFRHNRKKTQNTIETTLNLKAEPYVLTETVS